MSELLIEVPASLDRLTDVRESLEREIGSFAPGLLKTRWDGETLHLTGPGAAGTLDLIGGQLVARANLGPPASMMRPMIEEKMERLLRSLASPDNV